LCLRGANEVNFIAGIATEDKGLDQFPEGSLPICSRKPATFNVVSMQPTVVSEKAPAALSLFVNVASVGQGHELKTAARKRKYFESTRIVVVDPLDNDKREKKRGRDTTAKQMLIALRF
jgi:hypothetical protein